MGRRRAGRAAARRCLGACTPLPRLPFTHLTLPFPRPSPAGAIIKEMGWVALFTRGLPLRIVMIGTLTGLQWGIYDAVRPGLLCCAALRCALVPAGPCWPALLGHGCPARCARRWRASHAPPAAAPRCASPARHSLHSASGCPPASYHLQFKVYVGLPTTGSAEPEKK